MQSIPIVLVGKGFWNGLMDWMKKTPLRDLHTIDEADFDLFHLVDTAEEAFDLVCDTPERTIF